MSSTTPKTTDAFRVWLIGSSVLVIAAALFSASRAKPPGIFLLGFGAAIGVMLRICAETLPVIRNSRVIGLTMLLAGCGALLSFVPSYRRAAAEWNTQRVMAPADPMGAAILKQMEQHHPEALAVPPYNIAKYLSQRYFHWPPPWPAVVFGAEWIGCVLLAGACVGFGQAARKAGSDSNLGGTP